MAAPLAFFAMLLWNLSDRLLPVYQKNTADDIGSFTVVCVVGVLHCEYRQTFVLAMCGIVTFSM